MDRAFGAGARPAPLGSFRNVCQPISFPSIAVRRGERRPAVDTRERAGYKQAEDGQVKEFTFNRCPSLL